MSLGFFLRKRRRSYTERHSPSSSVNEVHSPVQMVIDKVQAREAALNVNPLPPSSLGGQRS